LRFEPVDHLYERGDLVFRTQACRRPVLKTHTQTQTMTFQDLLDLGQRLLAKVRCSQQLNFSSLHEVTDIHDVFSLEAVRRAYCQLKLVNRTQQDRIDLVLGSRANAVILTLQVNKD